MSLNLILTNCSVIWIFGIQGSDRSRTPTLKVRMSIYFLAIPPSKKKLHKNKNNRPIATLDPMEHIHGHTTIPNNKCTLTKHIYYNEITNNANDVFIYKTDCPIGHDDFILHPAGT